MGEDNVTTKQGLSKMISSVYCVFKSEPVIMMKTIICGRFFDKKKHEPKKKNMVKSKLRIQMQSD